ncbi:MAG TPA: translation elongation factor Ts [Geminicoccaceae bacterium]|nr:translation elongation factor Ts [Geminicoccaceae bacterium]
MAAVPAALVKQLRDQTGAGMMDCKAALTETGGDFEAAVDWLRKKGLAAAAKKAGRVASQGLVGVAVSGRRGAMVEVNSETDFVARNEEFQKLVRQIAQLALETDGDRDRLLQAAVPGTGRTVADEITQAIAVIGENINLRRSAVVEVDEGVIGAYVHGALAPGLGTIGVLVGLHSSGDPERLAALGKQLAMHVAAARPQAVSIERLDPATLERERAIYADQARATGKPENIIEKIVEGRVRKFYEEAVLPEQTFVIDTDLKVKDAIDRVAEEIGSSIAVTEFVRFALGEGLSGPGGDLAEEVAQLAGS